MIQSPCKGIAILKDKYEFGLHSQLWDDHVFNTIIRLSLERVIKTNSLSQSLKDTVDWFSSLDHELFLPYVRRVENPERFRTAFWNVNSYAQVLSSRFHDHWVAGSEASEPRPSKLLNNNKSLKKILFILKGPYELAHVEFLNALLHGSNYFSSVIEVHLLLLDATKNSARHSGIQVVSFSEIKSTFDKLKKYRSYCCMQDFDSICWVACVQNLTLYMGMQTCPSQAYLSMKYHSIIMPTIQKYAGIGSSSVAFSFDTIDWFRGRAFPHLSLKSKNDEFCLCAKKKFCITDSSFVMGCFVRSEKLHNIGYWRVIEELLSEFNKAVFVFASQDIPLNIQDYLSRSLFRDRIKHLGWVDTKAWCYVLDLYVDSFPRGSGNTMFEAIFAHVPCLIMDTPENRESSALNYIDSTNATKSALGITRDADGHVIEARKIIQSSAYAKFIAANQFNVLQRLKNSSHIFAKDYLNYFLDSSFTLSSDAS
ncbi:hypothetical protein [Synechococcus sp. KORDI-49]|uniref:hypothetical protein n=1 Tax=Synechococcus sp. KORDI-49 TaxID=585423 RepID=UPI00138E2E44|nr:hypothetical protein [Synechococcus sp. KORDI-49]